MTQQEFETLYGKTVAEKEFEIINAMYMLDENETKQDFVARYSGGAVGHIRRTGASGTRRKAGVRKLWTSRQSFMTSLAMTRFVTVRSS